MKALHNVYYKNINFKKIINNNLLACVWKNSFSNLYLKLIDDQNVLEMHLLPIQKYKLSSRCLMMMRGLELLKRQLLLILFSDMTFVFDKFA